MASVIKVDEIKSQANGSALSIASGGAVTVNNGLSGTLSGTISSSTVFPAGGTGNPISVAVICDQKAYNVAGGTFTLGAWRTRDLNTEISDPDSIVSISSNQFTLGAGTYFISWLCPAYKVSNHSSRLYDITGSTDLAYTTSSHASSGSGVQNEVFGSFIHAPSSSNTYEIQHRSIGTFATYGLGVGTDISGANSMYTKVIIYKLK